MESTQFKKLLLATSICFGLTACSSEEAETAVDPSSDSSAPIITVEQSSISIDEFEVIDLSFNVVDDKVAFKDLTVTILDNDDDVGKVILDLNSKKITYAAERIPGDSSSESLTSSFTVSAKDNAGNESRQIISVNVNDINSPFTSITAPPNQAIGFERTREDNLLNFWILEGQSGVVLNYDLTEDSDDNDTITTDLSVVGLLTKNEVDVSEQDSGSGKRVSVVFDVPSISVDSADIEVELLMQDNDHAITSVANITVVNEVQLSFTVPNNHKVSESNGATFSLNVSDEGVLLDSYNADYSARLLDQDGEILALSDYPFTFNSNNMSITFSENPGFLGDKSVTLEITASNEIENAAGEVRRFGTTASIGLILVDDRDDGFFSLTDKYEKDAALFVKMASGEFEKRVISSLSNLYFLQSVISFDQKAVIKEAVNVSFEQEKSVLDQMSIAIAEKINTNNQVDLESDIEDFSSAIRQFGSDTRVLIRDFQDAITLPDGVQPIGLINTSAVAFDVDVGGENQISHYVKNVSYGVTVDGSWVFSPRYKYLDVVDITDQFCF